MMPTDVWFYLFWIACALFGATGVALFIVLHPAVD